MVIACMNIHLITSASSPSNNLRRAQRKLSTVITKFIGGVVGSSIINELNPEIPEARAHSDYDTWKKSVIITDLLFIRHAESYNNILGESIRRSYGPKISEKEIKLLRKKLRQSDSTLSERGFKQLKLLEEYSLLGKLTRAVEISDLSDWIFISSPMRRCLLTSQAISRGLGNNIYVQPNLYESGGCYEVNEKGEKIGLPGSTSKEVEQEFPKYTCLPGMENGWYSSSATATTSETMNDFHKRADKVVDWIWSIHGTPLSSRQITPGVQFKNMAFVMHGNLMSAVIGGLQGSKGLITHYNTGFSRVQLVTGMENQRIAVVKFLNRSDHIPAENFDLLTGNNTLKDDWMQDFQMKDPI